jgi:hypothetical protein
MLWCSEKKMKVESNEMSFPKSSCKDWIDDESNDSCGWRWITNRDRESRVQKQEERSVVQHDQPQTRTRSDWKQKTPITTHSIREWSQGIASILLVTYVEIPSAACAPSYRTSLALEERHTWFHRSNQWRSAMEHERIVTMVVETQLRPWSMMEWFDVLWQEKGTKFI